MRIVFYSTNSDRFDGETFEIRTVPSCGCMMDMTAEMFPEHELIAATQLPAIYAADYRGNSVLSTSRLTETVILRGTSPAECASEILALGPDLAFAVPFWTSGHDWLGLNDALVAEILRKNGVAAVSHPVGTASACADKFMTHLALEKAGITAPGYVYVHNGRYRCAMGHPEIRTNVYREEALRGLAGLRFPVVIKDSDGLSSHGMEVAVSPAQAVHFLDSKRNRSDRIVEEFIGGTQFGAEIHGRPGHYTVLPPVMMSVNRYGITSQRQCMKAGPLISGTDGPEEMLASLAEFLRLEGTAQVDLVRGQDGWYVLDINTRLSGMSQLYASSAGIPLFAMLLQDTLGDGENRRVFRPVLNFKLPPVDDSVMDRISRFPHTVRTEKFHDLRADQKRAEGWCEVTLAASAPERLYAAAVEFATEFPDLTDPSFAGTARSITEKLVES